MKEEVSRILEECSNIMTNVTGTDVSREEWNKAKGIVRQKYEAIKDMDIETYNMIKADFDKSPSEHKPLN